MDRADEFLDLYKQLEQAAISRYGFPTDGTAISRLERLGPYAGLRAQLKYCREVRALLQHNPKLQGGYAVTPSEAMVGLLRSLLKRVKDPEMAMDRATPAHKMLAAAPEDAVLPVMERMRAMGYKNVPILEKGRVVGVFSESTVFRIVLDRPGRDLPAELTFSMLLPYMQHKGGLPKRFAFLHKTATLEEAESLFARAERRHNRLEMVFLTEHGKAEERYVGALTPWNVLEDPEKNKK